MSRKRDGNAKMRMTGSGVRWSPAILRELDTEAGFKSKATGYLVTRAALIRRYTEEGLRRDQAERQRQAGGR